MPRPSNGFIRAVSLNRKRVHPASTRLFRSQESPLWKLRGALGARVKRPRGRGSRRSPLGSAREPSSALLCPTVFPWLAVETPRWRFPTPRRGRVSFRRRRLQIPSTSLLAAQRPSPHGAIPVLAVLGSCLCTQKLGLPTSGGFGSPWGHTDLVGHRVRVRGVSALGLEWVRVICSSCVCVCASFCTEMSSVDEMRSWRASLGGTD